MCCCFCAVVCVLLFVLLNQEHTCITASCRYMVFAHCASSTCLFKSRGNCSLQSITGPHSRFCCLLGKMVLLPVRCCLMVLLMQTLMPASLLAAHRGRGQHSVLTSKKLQCLLLAGPAAALPATNPTAKAEDAKVGFDCCLLGSHHKTIGKRQHPASQHIK